MKTIVSSNNNHTCESTLKPSSWLPPLPWPLAHGTAALRKISPRLHAALRAAADTLATLSYTLQANHRIYLAIAFMLVLAPVANVSYRVFDHTQVVSGWYYTNYYDLFYVLCPWVTLILFATGIFLLFPQGSKRAWILTIPITSAISKILWLTQITSNDQFHTTVPLAFFIPAMLLALLWIFLIDWLLSRQYHGIDALNARIDAILNAPPAISDADKLAMLRTTWTQLKNFHKQY